MLGVYDGADDGRREVLHHLRLGEELEAADHREDRREQQRRPQRGELDAPHLPELARPVHLRGVVEVMRDRPQRRVEDQHVVADELPGDDVGQRREHECRPEQVGRIHAEGVGDLPGEAELAAVEKPPHQRAHDRGYRVGHEDAQPEQLRPPHPFAVDRQRHEQREQQHHRHLDDQEQPHATEPGEELRVGCGADVVVQADERGAADQPPPEKAQAHRVHQRGDDRDDEDEQERGEEQEAGDGPPPGWAFPLPHGRRICHRPILLDRSATLRPQV